MLLRRCCWFIIHSVEVQKDATDFNAMNIWYSYTGLKKSGNLEAMDNVIEARFSTIGYKIPASLLFLLHF